MSIAMLISVLGFQMIFLTWRSVVTDPWDSWGVSIFMENPPIAGWFIVKNCMKSDVLGVPLF
jgi:hypothetical protein